MTREGHFEQIDVLSNEQKCRLARLSFRNRSKGGETMFFFIQRGARKRLDLKVAVYRFL